MSDLPATQSDTKNSFPDELETAIRANRKISRVTREFNKSDLAGRIRYAWCWFTAAVMLLFIGAPALVFCWLMNRRTWMYPLALFGARMWLKACGTTVRVTGSSRLERDRSYVFASNHRSYLDTAAMFRYTGKRVGIVAKKELLKVPVLGQGMGFVNIIAIDRSNAERALASMNKAREVLEDGYSFGIFVEGTRAMPGEMLPFKKGAFHLALQTGASIVPVAMKNTDLLMGKKRGTLYPGTIEMVLLPPIEIEGKSVMELLVETRAAIARELYPSAEREIQAAPAEKSPGDEEDREQLIS